MGQKDWKEYEVYIFNHFKNLFPEAQILFDQKVEGIISKTTRQIDIFIKSSVSGFDLSVVVDCKFFNKNVDVKEVEAFIGLLHDVKASKGVLITNNGYSEAAYNRATYDTRDVELRIIDFKDLDQFQSFAAFPYSGKNGVYLPAPLGWIIDGTRREGMVASFYPAGLSFEKAFTGNFPLGYVNFIVKDAEYISIERTIEIQNEGIISHAPDSKIELVRMEGKIPKNSQIRLADIPSYNKYEITGLIDYGDYIPFFVVLSPRPELEKNLKKMAFLLSRVQPIKIIFRNQNDIGIVQKKEEPPPNPE